MENFPKWVFDNYPLGNLQDFFTILKEMEKHDCTLSDLLAYSDKHFQDLRNADYNYYMVLEKRRIDSKLGSKRCPMCGNGMVLAEVNNRPCSQVGGGFHSLWYCIDGTGCGYESYKEEPYVQEYVKYMKEFPRGEEKNDMKRRLKRAARRMGPKRFRPPDRNIAPPSPAAGGGKPCGGCGK